MTTNLKELNKRMRQAKRPKKKPDPAPTQSSDIERLAKAFEKSRQPIVNMPDRKPVEYKLEVTQRSSKTGDIISAKITPIFEDS